MHVGEASDTSRQARDYLHGNSLPLLRGLPLGASGKVELAVQVPSGQRPVLSRSDYRPPPALFYLELCYSTEAWNVRCFSPLDSLGWHSLIRLVDSIRTELAPEHWPLPFLPATHATPSWFWAALPS